MAFAPLFDPTQQFMARSGAPLVGGLLYVYRNTSQELATLKNVAGTTIANPVTLDADGRASGGVFVSDASTYTLVVKDAFEATQWTISAMSPLGGGIGGSVVTITPTLATGTKIADYTIDGESGSLFAPSGGGGIDLMDYSESVSIEGGQFLSGVTYNFNKYIPVGQKFYGTLSIKNLSSSDSGVYMFELQTNGNHLRCNFGDYTAYRQSGHVIPMYVDNTSGYAPKQLFFTLTGKFEAQTLDCKIQGIAIG